MRLVGLPRAEPGKSLRFYRAGLCPNSGAAPPSESGYVVMFLYYFCIVILFYILNYKLFRL